MLNKFFQPVFEVEQAVLEPMQQRDKDLFVALGGVAIAATLFPVLFTGHVPTGLKTLSLMLGVGCAGTGAAIAGNNSINQRSKWAKNIARAREEQLKSAAAHAVVYQGIQDDIWNDNRVLQLISQLPVEQQAYYLKKYGLEAIAPYELAAAQQMMYDQLGITPQQVGGVPAWAQGSIPVDAVESVEYQEPEITDEWIYDIVGKMIELDPEKRRYQHLIVNGGSQSGKSTLFSKILELFIKGVSGQGEKVQINLCDPKYPKTRWAIAPSFTGFEQVSRGVSVAIAELDNRKKLCIKAAKAGQEQPNFSRYVLIVDEWDSIWGKGKGYGTVIPSKVAEGIRNDVLRIIKEGAAYNFMAVVIGQSPLSEASGFSRSDANSTCRLVLAVEALKWAQDPGFPFQDLKEDLKAEIQVHINNEQRCVLVVPNLSSPYVQGIPKLTIEKLAIATTATPVEAPPEAPSKPAEQQSKAKHDPKIKPRDINQGNSARDLLGEIHAWYKSQPVAPTDAELAAKWKELSGKDLDGKAIAYLRGKLDDAS